MQLARGLVSPSPCALVWGVGAMALATLAGVATPSFALGVEDQAAGYVFQYFADADHVHVLSNLGSYDLDLQNRTSLKLHLNHEIVVVPAVNAPAGSQEAVDAITTASRPIRSSGDAFKDFTKERDEIQADVAHNHCAAGYYLSTETDYFAQLLRASYNRDFLDQNLNFSLGASYGWDSITPSEDQDTAGAPGYKRTTHLNAVSTQILSPTTVLRVGAEINLVRGLQYNPYRNVYVAGDNVPERHPDTRQRRDLFLRINQYLTSRASLKLSYKYYTDDWGIRSHTLGVRLNQYITRSMIVRYRYRYYTQGSAWFYRGEYLEPGGIDGYQTGDYRMGDFAAHLFGTRLDWALGNRLASGGAWSQLRLQLSYERYFNSNNFSANIFESGISLAF